MNRQELGQWLGLSPEQTGRLLPSLVRAMRHVKVPQTDAEHDAALDRYLYASGRAPILPPRSDDDGDDDDDQGETTKES